MNSEKINDDLKLAKVNYPLSASSWKDDFSPIVSSVRLADPTFIVSKNWNRKTQTTQIDTIKNNDINSDAIQKETLVLQTEIEDEKSIQNKIDERIETIEIPTGTSIPKNVVHNEKDFELNVELDNHLDIENSKELTNSKSNLILDNLEIPIIKKRGRPKKINLGSSISKTIKSNSKSEKSSTNEMSSDFYTWLDLINQSEPKKPIKQKTNLLKKPAKVKTKLVKKAKRAPKSVQILEIERSIKDSQNLGEEVISETLADLLTQQGHKDQAIRMYEKLTLKYPEKSSTFALLIKNLKS